MPHVKSPGFCPAILVDATQSSASRMGFSSLSAGADVVLYNHLVSMCLGWFDELSRQMPGTNPIILEISSNWWLSLIENEVELNGERNKKPAQAPAHVAWFRCKMCHGMSCEAFFWLLGRWIVSHLPILFQDFKETPNGMTHHCSLTLL